ncbi:hypothetical protein ACM39_10995 [Chryseobacterium sp. FH2]|nr:hypothetical protein ACM39_10995 [Chryseobacterium sp. FH2]
MINCAGFRNVKNNNEGLNINNLGSIDGNYDNYPIEGQSVYINSLADVFDRNTNMFVFKSKYDIRAVNLKLKIINEKKLNVKIYKKEKLLFDKDLSVKLKNDGFLYLKEKRFMIEAIPLVFGGWNFQKSRFTVDKDNNLHVQTNYFFCNGMFLIMNDWKTFHYNLIFKRLQP